MRRRRLIAVVAESDRIEVGAPTGWVRDRAEVDAAAGLLAHRLLVEAVAELDHVEVRHSHRIVDMTKLIDRRQLVVAGDVDGR